jgi:hypothetical protein
MGVPTSEVGYTSATTGREDHEVHKGRVVALGRKKIDIQFAKCDSLLQAERSSPAPTIVMCSIIIQRNVLAF